MIHRLLRFIYVVLLVPLGLCSIPACSPTTQTGRDSGGTQSRKNREDPLESARHILAAAPDRANIQLALQQVKAYLSENPEARPPGLSPEQKQLLQTRFQLDPGELAEVSNPNFTLLDTQHLAFCFLLRDAARSLQVDELSEGEKAAAAFSWVVRQVILRATEGEVIPPEFALRSGRGTPLERAHVFLALLSQLGIPGCLLSSPGIKEPWACGALVTCPGTAGPNKQVILFDHRLGLPVPGIRSTTASELARVFHRALPVRGSPDGQEIATLVLLRGQPEVLKALSVDAQHSYDVAPNQAQQAQVQLAVPLSSLAPRLKTLQEHLLPAGLNVNLGNDPSQLLKPWDAIGGLKPGTESVQVYRPAVGLLYRFLPEQEGGIDKEQRKNWFSLNLVPLGALPRSVQQLEGEPRARILTRFSQIFVSMQLDPRTPRDLILRGQFKEASEALTGQLEEVRLLKERLQKGPDAEERFVQWKGAIYQAYGDLQRAEQAARRGGSPEAVTEAQVRLDSIWKENQPILSILLDGHAALQRGIFLTYCQALCMHEQAERTQARFEKDSLARAPDEPATPDLDRQAVLNAWSESASWWDSFILENPGLPLAATARLWQARSQEGLGQKERARLILQDVGGPLTHFDQAARLFLARRLQTRP
jgi:hypothetical protein